MMTDLNNVGKDAQLIVKALIENDNLCKLLKNIERNPLEQAVPSKSTILHKNILIVPNVNSTEDTESRVVVLVASGDIERAITDLTLKIFIYTPYKEWLITGEQLRPFAIMSEINKSINDLKLNTLGQLKCTNFSVSSLGDEVGCYSLTYEFHEYS
jgi:hypothetical protein